MADFGTIQTIVNQVTIQTATAVVIVLRVVDAGLGLGENADSLREVHRQRHSGPVLKQTSFT